MKQVGDLILNDWFKRMNIDEDLLYRTLQHFLIVE